MKDILHFLSSRRQDSNLRPLRPERSALPNERKIKKWNQLEESRLKKVPFCLLLRALPAIFKWNQKFGDSG